jgi:hypothetical protein
MTTESTAAYPRSVELEELTYDEILRLLPGEEVGRLIVVGEHFPSVYPVNYRMDGPVVVFQSDPGTKLDQANHRNVGFHVDHLDREARTGWSILIEGVAEDSTHHRPTPNIVRARNLEIQPWPGGPKRRIVRIIPVRMTGRRIIAQAGDADGIG